MFFFYGQYPEPTGIGHVARERSRYYPKYGTLFLVFIYAPIIMIAVFSFNSNPINMMIWSGFTFDWYLTIFGYPTQLNEQTLYVESTDQLLRAVDSTTLPVFIYGMLRRGVKPEINAIATIMLTLSFIIASLGLYFRREH